MCLRGMNIFNLICHRKPERSFHFRGHQFPVCARCTGYYLSMAIYFTYTYFFFVDYSLYLLCLAILFSLIPFVDGFTQLLGSRESNNTLRFITGLIGGLSLGILIKACKYFIYLKGGL